MTERPPPWLLLVGSVDAVHRWVQERGWDPRERSRRWSHLRTINDLYGLGWASTSVCYWALVGPPPPPERFARLKTELRRRRIREASAVELLGLLA